MKQERIYWIDWAKAISIYAVILIHLHVTETIRRITTSLGKWSIFSYKWIFV